MPNQKAYDDIQRIVKATNDIWCERLGISHWEIRQVYLDSYYGDDGEEDFKITACTETRWQYEQAKIKWFLPSAVRHSLPYIEFVLVHELCHIVLAAEQGIPDSLPSPNEDWSAAQREKIELGTEKVARAIWRAYHPGEELPEAS